MSLSSSDPSNADFPETPFEYTDSDEDQRSRKNVRIKTSPDVCIFDDRETTSENSFNDQDRDNPPDIVNLVDGSTFDDRESSGDESVRLDGMTIEEITAKFHADDINDDASSLSTEFSTKRSKSFLNLFKIKPSKDPYVVHTCIHV